MANNIHLHIKVIVGSTREGRFSDTAAAWISTALKKREGVAVEVLNLRDYPLPSFSDPISPAEVKDGAYSHEMVRKWAAKIREADAFIIVTPEYNHGTLSMLKNALNWVYQEWNEKPVAFVSYGRVGRVRTVERLRLTAIQLHMVPIRTTVYIPGDQYLSVLFGKTSASDLFASMSKHAKIMITQLLCLAYALKNTRE